MATLVLSTVGTVLGGPIGGAIGALVGQSFDQELLGPATRGPRLGDLAVQTSSYGTQIPRIYGSMRVAGSVVWATDLVESEQTAGAKGQPDVTYSYSVSFAVALSSRRVSAIKRIWADGKLLRGDDGVFKVATTFRSYDGSEDQIVDPLIASIEGIANSPACRGLALAIFENLELAEFGNRIPFLTFEVAADDAPQTLGAILEDASQGAIASDASQGLTGYAAYGPSMRAALEPLAAGFALELFDDGSQLRPAAEAMPLPVGGDELGSSADGARAPRMQRDQQPVRVLPGALRLSYYDPQRDYQAGQARASAGEQPGTEAQRDIAAVLQAGDAKSLVEQMLACAWSARDRLTLRLPPSRLALEPGTRLELPLSPKMWTVDKATVDAFVMVVELRPAWSPGTALAADAGRIVANRDVALQPMTVALFDVPDILGASSGEPVLLLAAATPGPGWTRRLLSMGYGGQLAAFAPPPRKSTLGSTLTVLADGNPDLIDAANAVDIQLVDPDQWLTSADDDALAGGTNLAVLGSELIQFGEATPLGGGRFRLGRLLRGRAGTEWAAAGHRVGEPFCLIAPDGIRPLKLPAWVTGSAVSAAPPSGSPASVVLSAESSRPPAPVNLAIAWQPTGDAGLSWTRRSRNGWAWIDEVDAPLGESREQYRVSVTTAAGAIERIVAAPATTLTAADLAPLGAGPANIEVRQIGDRAMSRAATLAISLS